MDNEHVDRMQDAAAADHEVRAAAEVYRQGHATQAEACCREILVRVPGQSAAQALLGLIMYYEARYGEAEEIFSALVLQEPSVPMHWSNLGTARRSAKRFDAALAAYSRAAELGEKSAAFYFNVGLTHIDRCDFESARAVLANAARLAPEDVEIRYYQAQACYECRQTEEALRALEGWEALPDISSEVAANIGFLLMNLGEPTRAEVALREAARDPAPDPSVTLTLAQAYERSNRLAEARPLFKALAADPRASALGTDFVVAQARLAEREARYETACQLLEQVLRDVDDFHLRHYHLFPLAKTLDALQRYEEAFNALLEAHRSQAAHLAMTAPGIALRGIPTMAVSQFGCDPTDVATWDDTVGPPVSASPIFIVGFPRSGTTLLELTLDAHPNLKSMDEQVFVQNALDDLSATGVRYASELGRVSNAQLERVRASYWERVSKKVQLERGQRLVDKNPLNIARLPVIRRLFPHAHILLPVRHPCDVLLSCYMQHFRAPDLALLCANLTTLAVGYRRTMDFWYQQTALLKPAVREIGYESFVANFETEMRGIVDFLDLPWHDQLLASATHARSKGYISTPSYSQVIEPVNQRSVGRWRAYERHFSQALPHVRPYLDRWGYAA